MFETSFSFPSEFDLELRKAADAVEDYREKLAAYRQEERRLSNTRILLGNVGSIGMPPVRPHVRVILGKAWLHKAVEEGFKMELKTNRSLNQPPIVSMNMHNAAVAAGGHGARLYGSRKGRRNSVVSTGAPQLPRRSSVSSTASHPPPATSGRGSSVVGALPSLTRPHTPNAASSIPSSAASSVSGGSRGGRRSSVVGFHGTGSGAVSRPVTAGRRGSVSVLSLPASPRSPRKGFGDKK